MIVYRSIHDLRAALDAERAHAKTIGLVPTMGALHAGHMSLLAQSVEHNDLTVCSLFVNPIQFNNPEDLKKYPINEVADFAMLESNGCDIVFAPDQGEMYGEEIGLKMNFGVLESVLEGEFRPGHFSGVGVVVSKLFNIVQPHRAYFGQKDLQQLAIIRKLTRDLNFPIQIVGIPIMREANGLAMSSRNMRLSDAQRDIAAQLYVAMSSIKEDLDRNVPIEKSIALAKDSLRHMEGIQLEYMEIVDSDTMQPVSKIENDKNISICAAAFVGEVRIIDNLYIAQNR
ncbi:pantoate--beta-alanine ligase [Reichenbachiella agariperforans]|uniref:Pantothenate synthetase n=1 Tax=Reichenbachiella agariperforans TaxID=156994 RepID=A0A1M6RZR0_REIAG|nr:pantoate--beta-alanine ligase [Reichenbachiella agariperforans]SHK37807.1 pantoate--beta-alanine ligase [Reichenbachiella agariperforans]